MRKGRNGKRKKRRKEKRKEKNGVFSGHYVIASSLPPQRLRPNDDRWNAARSCQLTCSFERNSQAANLRKSLKYTTLKTDLEENGYKCFLVPFEVGSRGQIHKSTKSNILNSFATVKISAKHNLSMKNM